MFMITDELLLSHRTSLRHFADCYHLNRTISIIVLIKSELISLIPAMTTAQPPKAKEFA